MLELKDFCQPTTRFVPGTLLPRTDFEDETIPALGGNIVGAPPTVDRTHI